MLAQSCLAPGFFTMASNIITASLLSIFPEMPKWKKEYLSTSNKVILAETFSPTFVGLTFQEVAEIVYLRLNLVLIAMEARKYEGGQIWINPNNKKITPNSIGLFITASSDAAKRAWFYCRVCHENIRDVEDIKKCSCKKLAKARFEYFSTGQENMDHRNGNGAGFARRAQDKQMEGLRKRKQEAEDIPEDEGTEAAQMRFDGTGCFHWCSGRDMVDCLLTRQEATVTMFAGHIVVAVFAESDSPALGLRNLVMPLRASNIPYPDLRHIIIVGNIQFIQQEWPLLRNMPKISVMDGSPMSRADLRSVKVNLCRTCIILSAKAPDKLEPVLADKEIIMAALNIKSMNFGSNASNVDESIINDSGDSSMNHVNILLDLSFSINVRYLDDQELYISDNIELYKTLPFASGTAMARGILDSLMSATYFNASALKLLRQWVTGGATIELEKSLAEGAGLRGGYSTPEIEQAKNRIRVEEIVLKDSPWSRFAEYGARFSDLFSAAIRDDGTLCLAINRLLDEDIEENDDPTRVVISCPDNLTILQPMDHIIALVQWGDSKEKKE